jgi:hypothetical protein
MRAPVEAGAQTPVPTPSQPPEQLRFAAWLQGAARLGLAWLVLSFALTLTGWLPSAVAPAQLIQAWGLPLAEFLPHTQAVTGWAWLGHLGHGEGAGLAGIALLAACVLPGLLALLPLFLSRKERALAALCAAQVLVLLLAASGWIGAGH